MITTAIGRRFLAHYNQQRGTHLSARDFFEQKFLSTFYDHPKYLMDGGNTALTNPKIPKGTTPTPENRQKRFATLMNNIQAGYLDTRTTLDFPAATEEKFATSSGQVTDLTLPFDSDTAYYSWIGSGFGIGIAGGQVILFDDPLILDTLFMGWQHYREFLNDPAYDNLPGNKMTSWNGQWLTHAFSDAFRAYSPTRGFAAAVFGSEPGADLEIKPQSWLNVLLCIAEKLPVDSLTGYVYKMGQTNSTYGFIPFRLAQLQRPEQIYIRLFGEGAYQNDRDKIRMLYGSARSFQRICEQGAVGVAALEPKGIRDIMQGGNYKPTDEITFKTYITWLLAMLNKDEFWDEAGQAAELLLAYEKGAGKLKADRGNQVEQLRNAGSQRLFLNALVPVMEATSSDQLPQLAAFAKAVNKLPSDNFSYFQTLIKLRYAEKARLSGSETTTPQLTIS